MTVAKTLTKRTNINRELYPNGSTPPLPENMPLTDITKVLPKEIFNKNMTKAWGQVALTVAAVALSMYIIAIVPWYLLPIAWIFAGTAMTGMFVIGHDCGHLSFSRDHQLNDLVGLAMMSPLVYPFEPWRIQHNIHHNNTNKLDIDNAWQPFQKEYYNSASELERWIMRTIKGPAWWFASVGHLVMKHFSLDLFTPEQQPKVRLSLNCVYAFSAVFFPAMWYFTGIWGIIKFYAIPWLIFHFWMSTMTMIHHTLPHLPFLPESKWTDSQARLGLTVHCEFPAWIEILTHHINVHIPHHVSTAIPSYNLRAAHNVLKKHFAQYMNETTFSFELIKDIINNCHLYHEEVCYVPFDEANLKTAGTPEPNTKSKPKKL